MIVMKFGGSSLESAAAIGRVAGIVQAACPAGLLWWSLPWGRPPISCWRSRMKRSRVIATRLSQLLSDLREYPPCAKLGRWSLIEKRSETRSDWKCLFQDLSELVKGLSVWAN